MNSAGRLSPSAVLRVERFRSIDEFRAIDVVGDMRSTPLRSDGFSAARGTLALPDCLLVLQRSFARRMEGNVGPDRGVGLIIPFVYHVTMNGHEVDNSAIGVARSLVPARAVEWRANTYLIVRFDSDMHNRGWADFGNGIRLFRPQRQTMQDLRSAIMAMFHLASNSCDLRQFERLSGSLQETLLAGLDGGLVQDSVRQARPGSFDRHRRLVQQLDELVSTRTGSDLYSNDLAHSLGVSVRTLQSAVHQVRGMSLHRHLRSKRLWSVRRLLVTASPLVTVAAAAQANGFWHMGDFARTYSRAFGETPSETLARARGL